MVHHPYLPSGLYKKGFDLGILADTRRFIKSPRDTQQSGLTPSVVLLLAEAGRLEVW